LPQVDFHFGTEYPLTVWMKAEKVTEVVITVGQNIAPWGNCSAKQLVQVPPVWTKYDVPLKVTAPKCEPVNNRLVFATAGFSGKLWIADLSLDAARWSPRLIKRHLTVSRAWAPTPEKALPRFAPAPGRASWFVR
jgi:hypothetical protein